LGTIALYIGFVSALLATVFYFLSAKKNNTLRPARIFFHLAVFSTVLSAAYLLHLILSHDFQFTYVWSNSSRELPLNLLIATFYAGQEGSFHLWALLMAVLGVFLQSYLSKKDFNSTEKFEPYVLGVFTLIQTFLLFILIVKSPYKMVWESFPNDVQAGFLPENGRGLNPLLQNFWMSIHPPILFTGFSSLSIPFCFAISALLKNKYDSWTKVAMPWVLFGSMILGLGIMLGGYWAYGVLGWGGYWGWDPVENASLVPWVLMIAAIHSMLSEQNTGRLKKTSLLLCVLAYLLVLYSSFLTRSGILGDASVHSFVDPGQEVYLFLIVFLSLFTTVSFGLIIFRAKNIKSIPEPSSMLSKETTLFIGSITLCAAALVIAVGTSWPIFARGTVEPDFYNKMILPIAILIAFINGTSILLKWKNSEEKQFIRSLLPPLVMASAVTIVFVIFGMQDFLIALFAAAALFGFFINAETAYRIFRRNKTKAGGYIAHTGVMILFLGIIASSKYSVEENISLPLNESKDALGYKFTYKGATSIPNDAEKYHFNVVAEKDGRAFLLQPVMYYSTYSEGVMKNPDIANLITKDLYLSPMGLDVPEEYSIDDEIELTKGEEKEMKGMKIKFIDFDRSKFNRENMSNQNIMGAELDVTLDGKKYKVTAQERIAQGTQEHIPVRIENNDRYTFYLTQINVQNESNIKIAVVDETLPKQNQSTETLILTASIKPFINLVWSGTILMVIGFFFSVIRRYRAVKKEFSIPATVSSKGVSTNGVPASSIKEKISKD